MEGTSITECKLLEEERLKNCKLESITFLAGGIAHDFNNILTIILGYLSLTKLKIYSTEDMLNRIKEAEIAALQAKELTQQLLTFVRGGEPEKKVSCIKKLIVETVNLVLSGSTVKGILNLAAELWPVYIDKGQICQVLINLIINAVQAIPQGGRLYIGAENVANGFESFAPLEQKQYVKISIKDEGMGIPRQNLEKVFDHYFTTKQGGSGLGLATSHSIIRKHGGSIRIESEVGIGTTVYVYLPVAAEEHSKIKREAEQLYMGKGKILFMDDEEAIREILGEMLELMQYETTLARDGSEAVELYQRAKEAGQPFDAVIMDFIVRGGMGGMEALKQLREIDSDIRAIIVSGYSNDKVFAELKNSGYIDFIQKPFEIEELSNVLHKLLLDKAT